MLRGVKFMVFLLNFLAYFMPSSKTKANGEPSKLLVDDNNFVYHYKRKNKKQKIWNCCKKGERKCSVEVRTSLEVSLKMFGIYKTSCRYQNLGFNICKSSCRCQLLNLCKVSSLLLFH